MTPTNAINENPTYSIHCRSTRVAQSKLNVEPPINTNITCKYATQY